MYLLEDISDGNSFPKGRSFRSNRSHKIQLVWHSPLTNFTRHILIGMVICTETVRTFFNVYLFVFSSNICINIFINIHPMSALIFIDIPSNTNLISESIYIYIHIMNIFPITASPDPLYSCSTIITQNLQQSTSIFASFMFTW